MSDMNPALAGRVALVTGATRGIGRSIAERLLEAGASVAICGRQEADVARAVAELAKAAAGRAAGVPCDVGRYEDVVALFRFIKQNFGRLDIVVNNAGIGGFQPVDRMSPEEWRAVIETNLSGVFYCTREAVPLLRGQGGGDIINIGSLAGRNAMAGGAAYNASKFGLIGLTEASMLDLRHDNIRVSCVMPGSVATAFAGPSGGRSGAATADWKIAPRDVADAVLHIVTMPPRTHASRIEIRPTRPPK